MGAKAHFRYEGSDLNKNLTFLRQYTSTLEKTVIFLAPPSNTNAIY